VTPDDVGGIPDVIGLGLRLLFCGINPGLLSASSGHHFARPGNRFWKALAGAGITDRLLKPSEQGELLRFGVGITNLVDRPTAGAGEVGKDELRQGGLLLAAKVAELGPTVVAILGMQAYRTAFNDPRAAIGPQPIPLGDTAVWLLPNPSGLQARYQLAELTELFRAAWVASGPSAPPAPSGPPGAQDSA
jgi:TDG/mug DNA glycosylase family protein